MQKGLENFSHRTYKDSGLNFTAAASFSYNRNNTVSKNQNTLADKLDEAHLNRFIYNTRKALNANKANEDNSEVCYDYTH